MEPQRTDEVKIAVLEEQMKALNISSKERFDVLGEKVDALTNKIDDSYLKKEDFMKFFNEEFKPVKKTTEKLYWNLGLLIGGGGVSITLVNWFVLYKNK